jgi:hypothetical protein
MPSPNILGGNLHSDLRSKDYFVRTDDSKKLQSNKVKSSESFGKIFKQNFGKLNVNVEAQGKDGAVKELQAQKFSAEKTDDGTDFALKRLSEDFEKQILGIMWNLVFDSMNKNFEGGLGEEIFHKELVDEMVKLSNTGEMGEIANSIYLDL